MATLKPFTSTTLEGAFLEAAFLLQQGELNYIRSGDWKPSPNSTSQAANSTSQPITEDSLPNFMNITVDTDQQRCTITATLLIQVKSNSFGGYLLAEEFIKDEYVYPSI